MTNWKQDIQSIQEATGLPSGAILKTALALYKHELYKRRLGQLFDNVYRYFADVLKEKKQLEDQWFDLKRTLFTKGSE